MREKVRENGVMGLDDRLDAEVRERAGEEDSDILSLCDRSMCVHIKKMMYAILNLKTDGVSYK